jgi:hypothetical protein
LNPILKLFFNPAPIARALSAQAAHSNAAAAREAELYTRQAEWNALQYEIVQRLVTELARATLETQNVSLRMESLDAKLDFNERRVRAMELAAHNRPVSRTSESTPATEGAPAAAGPTPALNGEAGTDGARRRRRRRRGRRSGVGGQEGAGSPISPDATAVDVDNDNDADEDELAAEPPAPVRTSDPGGSAALEPAHHFSLLQPEERYPSGEAMPVSPTSDARSDEATLPSSLDAEARSAKVASSPGTDNIAPASDDTGPEPSER